MKQFYVFAFLLPLSLVFGTPQIEFMQKLNSGTPHLEEEINSIPFELYGHKIYVKTKINNSNEMNFVLDTGAITIIDTEAAEKLNLERGIALPGLDSLKQGFICKNEISVNIGNVSVNNFIPIITDLPEASDHEPNFAGFIGSDLLRFFCVSIDYQNQKLVISSNKIIGRTPEYTLTLDRYFPLGFPLIDCVINKEYKIQLMIDTGSPFSIVAPLSMIEESKMFNNQKVIKSIGNFMKWPSTNADYNYVSNIKTLQLKDYEITDIPVYFAELPRMLSLPLIGKAFLESFITTIDFINNKVYLYPNDQTLDKGLFSTGIGIKKKSGKIIIKGIWENSPAAKNNIQIGEEILEINQYTVKDISIQKINSILDNSEIEIIRLKLKNKEENRVLTLHKKNLL